METTTTCIIFPPRRDGRVVVFMRNDVTGVERVKLYKTMPAAKGAVTRFQQRAARIYVYGREASHENL